MNLPFKKVNDEVCIASDPIVRFDARAIKFVKESALNSPRGLFRICAHKEKTNLLHEMLIGIRGDSYIRPHRHQDKVESFHLVEGSAEIIVLEDGGEIADIIELGPEKNFYYRLDFPMYHTLLVHSPVLVIHETTNGPFEVESSDLASFSPPEGDWRVKNYLEALKAKSKEWKSARGYALAVS